MMAQLGEDPSDPHDAEAPTFSVKSGCGLGQNMRALTTEGLLQGIPFVRLQPADLCQSFLIYQSMTFDDSQQRHRGVQSPATGTNELLDYMRDCQYGYESGWRRRPIYAT
jgi:hypothetical protein